jgi:isoleucyl-tRNA synthetase
LKNEGIARELVNRIQNLRKDSGFEVTDKIKVTVLKESTIEKAIHSNEQYIKDETLTEELLIADSFDGGSDIEFDDLKTRILITK